MKTNHSAKYIIAIALIGIFFSSCRKEQLGLKDTYTTSSADNAIAEAYFTDANNISDQAADNKLGSFLYGTPNNNGEKNMMTGCATVTFDTISIPHTITIDFGASNCTCVDGRNRRGIIHVSYMGRYRDSASTHTITFTDYFVNDNQIIGTHTVTNNGRNNNGHLNYSISVNGTIVKADGGGTISWTSSRTREWVEGEETPNFNDDVYLISGSANGTNTSGQSYSAIITTPLKVKLNCHNIVSGIMDLTPTGKPTRTINWGNGDCDNQATVTINGHVYNITLH